ncbi:hypothetical protein [Okeania sp.]|nr:hypothetical protein [Okeania sp.]MEB3341837.1 hypothetical protein [Okeania sp.]
MTNSLIQYDQNFAIWAIILSAATIGFWSEKNGGVQVYLVLL